MFSTIRRVAPHLECNFNRHRASLHFQKEILPHCAVGHYGDQSQPIFLCTKYPHQLFSLPLILKTQSDL